METDLLIQRYPTFRAMPPARVYRYMSQINRTHTIHESTESAY